MCCSSAPLSPNMRQEHTAGLARRTHDALASEWFDNAPPARHRASFQHSSGLRSRAARFVPTSPLEVRLGVDLPRMRLRNISASGLAFDCVSVEGTFAQGCVLPSVRLFSGKNMVDLGPGVVARAQETNGASERMVAVALDRDQSDAIRFLAGGLKPYAYVTGELAGPPPSPGGEDVSEMTLDQFQRQDDVDLLAKCRNFSAWIGSMQSSQTYQRLYRVTLTGGIDNHVTVFDPGRQAERAMLCFDSNSYLGLHRHPRVIEEVTRVTKLVGYGTPSAQLLCGTNRYLRELEQSLAELHGREDTLVFPTGFAANVGAIHALLRDNDAVIRDRHAHASIHEGCRTSSARIKKVFGHNRMDSLDSVLRIATNAGCSGKLVVTDGVFSMHGSIAPLPELVATCRKHEARLMVDDAHGLGVLGENGAGIEEHFGMRGSVDVLMGTLSKALGAVGGYICGSRELIDYLRWFAPSGLFTTALPAPVCAGAKTALELVRSEPIHRERLREHIRTFVPALRSAGFITSDPISPIVTVFIGAQSMLWDVSRELWDAGIKCGNVMYPAVNKSECILRFTLNARHSPEDLSYAIDTLTAIGRRHGILGRTREEIQEVGRARSPTSQRLAFDAAP
jgi:4-hydroxy-2,2'-bipyrrole-5-methanol synthase